MLLGSPGTVEGAKLSSFDRLMLLPGAGGLFGRLPASEKGVRSTLRQLGHGATLDAGELPQVAVDWAVAVQRDTDSMRNDLAVMARMGTFRHGFDVSLTIGRELAGAVRAPTYVLWGTEEVYGDEAIARSLVAAMPSGELELHPGAGHLCWFDDPDHAAAVTRRHVLASDAPTVR